MAAGEFPVKAVVLLEKVQRCHDGGNTAFRSHHYSKAQEKYEAALDVLRQLYESFGWDPYVMSVIVEKDQKLLCNLSKVHRLQGHVMVAVEMGRSCVAKFPQNAKGHYCLAEANRDSIGCAPIHLAFQPIREAVIHFSEAYKLSHDKQAFLECLVLAVPGGLLEALPHVPESDKKTVFQHVVDCLIEKPEAALEMFLRFFLIHSSSPSKSPLECGHGCAVGYVTFKEYYLSTLLRSIVSLDVLQAVVKHGVQVDVGTIVDVIKNRHTSKSDIVKLIVPSLPKAVTGDCTAMKPVVDACLHAKQSDLLEYLLQQGVGFLPDSEEQILQWKSSSAAVVRVREAIKKQKASKTPPSAVGTIEQIQEIRELGTTAFKAKRYREAKGLYMQAYESFAISAVGQNNPVMAEEMQKVLGNLSVVERSLKNHEASVKWAKKCVEEFPTHAKGWYRLAEAYRYQASGLKGGQRSDLLSKSAENFGRVFTLSKEKLAYFECLMVATEAGSLHVVPSVPAPEKDSLAQFIFQRLQKWEDRPENLAHFIQSILSVSPKVLQKIATPLVPVCLKDCPLSVLPSSKLPLAHVKILIEKGMMVDMASVCENIEGRKEELEDAIEALFIRLPLGEKSPYHLQTAVRAAVVNKAGLVLAMLLRYGAMFPDDPELKASIFSWDTEILSVHVIKKALKGDFPKDVQCADIIQVFMQRADYVRECGSGNVSIGKFDAAKNNFEEAIECYISIEKLSVKKAKAVALQGRADVYFKKAELERSKAASQMKRDGMDLYLKSFQLQRDPEVFRSMLLVAIMEGEEYLGMLPDLHRLKRSEVEKMLHFTLKSLLDKDFGCPKELVTKCIMFLLIPWPMGVGSPLMYLAYGQGFLKLDDFTLSDMLLVVGFHPWSIQHLVEQGIRIDAASVMTVTKEVAKAKDSNSEHHRSLLLLLYERCTVKNTQLFLDTAISVKEREFVQQLLTDGAQLDENNMKSLLSWGASHLVPSLVRAILKSDPPLHVKNSKGESIVSIVARYDMTDCVEALMEKGLKISDLAGLWHKQSCASVLKAFINQGAQVALGDLSVVVSAKKDKQATSEECASMARLICAQLSPEDFRSHAAQDWLRHCIEDHFIEVIEVLLKYGVCPSDADAYQLLSWKSARVSRDMLSALLRNGMNPTLQNAKGESVLDIVLQLQAYDLLQHLVAHYQDLSCCSLASVFDHQPNLRTSVVTQMIDKGATVLQYQDMISPVTVLYKHLTQAIEGKVASDKVVTIMDNLVLVLKRGASIKDLVPLGSSLTTPVHVATYFATETGSCQLLEFVLNKCGTPSGGQYLNSQGQTPLHGISRSKGKPTDALFHLLLKAGVDPKVKDKYEKTALEYCTTAGRTYNKLCDYQRAFVKEEKSLLAVRKREKEPLSVTTAMPEVSKGADKAPAFLSGIPEEELVVKEPVEKKPVVTEPIAKDPEPDVKKPTVQALVDVCVKMVELHGLKEPQYFPTEGLTSISQVVDEEESHLDNDGESSEEDEDTTGCGQLPQVEHIPKKRSDGQNLSQGDFDGLTWEIDCTEKFRKHLGGLPEFLRKKAISLIQRLASGEWHRRFQKCVGGEQASDVYELKLTKGMRIIWQRAIDYSSRCSEGLNRVVYSEIIRLWDVVKHKDIQHSVDYVTDSLRKGRYSHVKYSLQQCTSHSDSQIVSTRDRIPRLFLFDKLNPDHKDAVFSPPALPGDRDYNVITFYAFSPALVQSILSSGNDRQDFPFKGWPEEYDIISLQEGETILLLGRSGTGKTTCCVYRLWNQCNLYWKEATEPKVMRFPLLFMKQTPVPVDDDDSDSTHPVQERKLDVPPPVLSAVSMVSDEERRDNVAYTDLSVVEQEDCYQSWQEQEDRYQSWQEQMNSASSRVAVAQEASTEMDVTPEIEEVRFDHLHQVFITKNPVLVSQVKKKFYDLAASAHHMKNHLQFETTVLPPTFQEITDYNFPLFLTSFQWLNLLDASLGDEDHFFTRSEAGILLIDLRDSAGEFSTSHDDIGFLDELEPHLEEDIDMHGVQADRRETQRSEANARRIVDCEYFCDVIWPQITKQFVDLRRKYDPVLIWMEIRSFLKGSYEALMTGNGHLDLAEYEKIGAKRASNFSVERKEVYKLFRKYEKYLSQNQLVDQCDWVFHLFRRLTKQSEVSFVIHKIYIDEVQDFTEAELYLIIHCCRFPNGLFLTGDTAQSIMRGVSFRFQDLRSLFYHVSESYLARGARKLPQIVPKVHQLTQNFRSHSGILNLAALCIRLLQHFFPHSIDILPEDCGLFPGPAPVVLHAASTSDLAIILKGNRREASTIEFGAHQAILVQSDEAKSTLPNELAGAIVLTIFEAKGLEFDDVLLYNFFANSKASREWRLVLQYLTSEGVPISNEFPILDGSVLRPLKFDGNQHRCLNAELKYFYTAVTRAKCNLWIYDTDPVKHSPMYYYLMKKELVRSLSVSDMSGADVDKALVQESSPEEWKSRGDYFMKKRLWEPAQKCYDKCGEKVLAMEAEALFFVSMARKTSDQLKEFRELCQQAAELFLQCATSPDNLFQRHLNHAATCLYNSKDWHTAALLYESIQEYSKAFKSYHQGKHFEKASEMREKQGKYHEALQCLHAVGKYPQALKKALGFKQRGIEVTYTGLTVEDLAYRTARHHQSRQELKLMKECIDLLPDVDDKVRLFKAARLYREAVRLLVKEDLLEDAFKILAAQKQYDEGIKLATSKGHGKQVLGFLLMKARALPVVRNAIKRICAFQELIPSAVALDISQLKDALKTDLLPILGEMSIAASKYHLEAKCPLLCVEMTILRCICHLDAKKCSQNFSPNDFGMLEQMRIWIGLELFSRSGGRAFLWQVESLKVILEKCQVVMNCFFQLSRVADIAEDVSDITCSLQDWYGIEKGVNSVLMPMEQDVWLNLSECKKPNTDDGIMMLDGSKVISRVKCHLYHSLQCWLNICIKAVEEQATQPAFDACHDVIFGWTTGHSLQARPMRDFLRHCCVSLFLDVVESTAVLAALVHHLNLDMVIQKRQERMLTVLADKLHVYAKDVHERNRKLKSKVTELLAGKKFAKPIDDFPVIHSDTGTKSKRALLSYFSPETSVYIPLSRMHLVLLDEYPAVKRVLLSKYLPYVCRDVNAFMSAWWMTGTNELQQLMMTETADDDYHLMEQGKNIHCFLLWTHACSLLDLPSPKPLSFCKILLNRFFGVVIKRKSLKKFSCVNALVILELLTATLVGMLSCQGYRLWGQGSTLPNCVPHLYEHVVQLFNDSRHVKGKSRPVRLMDAVYQSVQQDRNIQGMLTEARRFLIEVIELILGKSFKHFNVLSHVITGKNNVRNGTLRRFCILLITLLGNLELLGQPECYQYRHQLVHVVQSAMPKVTDKESVRQVLELCNHLCTAVQTATCTTDLFYFASQLCCFGKKGLAVIQINDRSRTLHFQLVPLNSVSNVAFPELTFATIPAVVTSPQPIPYSPPVFQSGVGETAWPERTLEGQVMQLPNTQGPISAEDVVPTAEFSTDAPFVPSLSQPSEESVNTAYDYEEDGSVPEPDTDGQVLDASAEEFIKSGWCKVCGMQVVNVQHPDHHLEQMEEQSEASMASETIHHHIQTTIHMDNVEGYRKFDELNGSIQQTVLPLVTAILHNSKTTMQNHDRQFDNLTDKLLKSYQKLQEVLTTVVAGQRSHHFWKGKCTSLRSQAGEVERFAMQLKEILPEVEPVATSQVRRESSDENDDGLELEEQALLDAAEGRPEEKVKLKRRKKKHK